MACYNTNCCYAPLSRAYNNTAQAQDGTLTFLTLLGAIVADNGMGTCINGSSMRVQKSGAYHFAADVTFTATAAGDEVVQLYLDSVALPCAIATATVAAAGVTTMHVETDIDLTTCSALSHNVTVGVSGVAGTVNHVCAGVWKHPKGGCC